MAVLLDLTTHKHIFLYAHHSFGRLAYAVDTLITDSVISKHHAIIEWYNDQWFIRDLSSNGSWVNQAQLTTNTRYPLKKDDIISFATADSPRFQILDLSAPHDSLIPCRDSHDFAQHIVNLQPYHLLPNQEQPEVAIFYDNKTQQWCIEKLNQATGHTFLNENDEITINGCCYLLKLSHAETQTDRLDQHQDFAQLNFIFELSQDEEVTELRLQTPDDVVDFHARSHHYLTLNLARYRVKDAQKGLDQKLQGWVHPEILARDLGIELSHLNIQIHRARKQFSDVLDHHFDAQQMIERHAGKVRFGGSEFKIYKGHQLECQWPTQVQMEH